MSDTREYAGHSTNVGCDVIGCKYHTAGNCCSASHINVQNESAQRKGETYCSTFSPKSNCCGC